MRIGIVQFPGSNCERETKLAVKRAEMQAIEFLWNDPLDKLRSLDGYIIVGGFSYEDRSRAGIIAAHDPIMSELKQQSEQGKPILGICNGAQVLVEAGLVPGLENNKLGLALTENKRIQNGNVLGSGYYNAWVHMRLSDEFQRNAFTKKLSRKTILNIPIAHAEGRFVMTEALLSEVRAQGLNVFQYCDPDGNIINDFPINPNGSIDNIAAISNKAGNVMAMMPHPERSINGDAIFHSMRDYIAAEKNLHTPCLNYYPRQQTLAKFSKDPNKYECIVELVITDNHALTVQNTLQQLGFPVIVKRQIHWEIECDTAETFAKIKQSGVLFNNRKEVEVSAAQNSYLVRAKDDLIGMQKKQSLQHHFNVPGLKTIQHGILWQFNFMNTSSEKAEDTFHKLLSTNIIHNPYAHDCYQYL